MALAAGSMNLPCRRDQPLLSVDCFDYRKVIRMGLVRIVLELYVAALVNVAGFNIAICQVNLSVEGLGLIEMGVFFYDKCS